MIFSLPLFRSPASQPSSTYITLLSSFQDSHMLFLELLAGNNEMEEVEDRKGVTGIDKSVGAWQSEKKILN